ncbi:serine hydrolase domain-containing protein [Paenibacillus senegalensis]|uniref:serine hydrolase domain-containing protein n=1 Tax=Paenibacillus senegalensis TaxID=1465766 RepID=UPI000288F677|nr:serine hydrolase domain-containing protein [Paenibacillus senegalensis]
MAHHDESIVGNQERLSKAFSLLDAAAADRLIPGAVAAVLHRGELIGVYATGYAVDDGVSRIDTSIDTIYDCASLTKVAVTLPLLLICIEKGLLDLNEPVSAFMPSFAAAGKGEVTVRHLASHTSGLPGHLPIHDMNVTPQEAVEYIAALSLVAPAGTQVIYSDLGFIVLGHICAELLGLSLPDAAARYVFEPLGMSSTAFNPPAEWKSRIAATEYSNTLGRCLHGEVHDENAYALGGACGHAGLFSTADDLVKVALAWLRGGRHEEERWLSPLAVQAALQPQTNGLNGCRGLGWVLRGDSQDVAGDLFSSLAFGHTGFTGTSMWMDPVHQLGVVLLTNRVHYGRGQSLTRLRARFHNAVAACLEYGQDLP